MAHPAELTPPAGIDDDPWSFACPDWWQRLQDGRSLIPDLPLDAVAVARAVGIFNKLHLPDVAGQPAMKEAAGDWQRDIVAALFGSVDDTGFRRVREPFVLVPKKNSKTTGAAAIMLTALLMDPVLNQAYYLYGPTQEIADRGFGQAVGMIEADPTLVKRFRVQTHLKTIRDLKTGSFLKVQTFDQKVATGAIPKGMLIDEMHILGKVAYASRVLGQLRGGMLARPDAFMLMITTQSDEPPAGVFKAELGLARAIRDGRVTGAAATMLPVLYEFPESVQTDPKQPWKDPAIWPFVLPNLGRSIRLDMLEADFAQAKEKDESELRRWVSQHLNIEVGLGLHAARWRGADYWEAQGDPSLTLESLIERCEVVVAGVDGGGLDDLFGLSVAGRCAVTKDWLFWFRAWAHHSVMERRKDIAERLNDFIEAGDLVLCPDATSDIDDIATTLEQVLTSGKMPEKAAVGLDPQGVAALVDALNDKGFTAEQVVAIGQGYRLSSAIWGQERKLSDGTMWHDGSGMMNWCCGNAKAEQAGNAVLITKAAAGKAKIDPLMAGFNAAKLLERGPVAAAGGLAVDDWIAGMAA